MMMMIIQKINQTPLAILNYNLVLNCQKIVLLVKDINMMLNSFLNRFFRPSHGTIQRIHKMRSSKRVIGGITFAILTLSNLKKDFCLLANNYNYPILNDYYKSVYKT